MKRWDFEAWLAEHNLQFSDDAANVLYERYKDQRNLCVNEMRNWKEHTEGELREIMLPCVLEGCYTPEDIVQALTLYGACVYLPDGTFLVYISG